MKTNTKMEQRLTIITLGVSDVKKSTEFYESTFGWKKSEMSNENISFFTLNGIQLALYTRKDLVEDATVITDGNGFKGFTLAYNTKSEIEVDQIIRELRIKGVEIIKEPQKVNWGGYSSYVSDPDGHLWEIAFNPFLGLDEEGNVKE
jgi:predicted lactoylglutathione lyase